MKRKYILNNNALRILILLSCLFYPIATSSNIKIKNKKMEESPTKKENTVHSFYNLSEEENNWVDSVLNTLSLREKAAQLVMPWVTGNYLSEDSHEYKRLQRLVQQDKVGGLIFFKGDIMNEAILINKMQKLANIPLLVASDFERGLAMRLSDGLEFPYNMALAATNDPQLAYEMGKVVAIESRAIGIHQNYAPVADINNNAENPIINIRSYSEDKNIVSLFSSAFIQGTIDGGNISTVKHFPGHGNTEIDSHQDVPTLTGSKEELRNLELAPFQASINSGVQSVMVGHLNVPAYNENKFIPATLSKPLISDLLKTTMGFKGLVITDAMNMSAITKYYSVAQATVMAIQAGVDLILFPPDEETAINAIYNTVVNGTITEERINQSVRKLLAAKKWLNIEEHRFTNLNSISQICSSNAHLKLAEEIADKSITLVKDEAKMLPLNFVNKKEIAVITISEGYGIESSKLFQNLISQKNINVNNIYISRRSSIKDYKRALQLAKLSDEIIIPAYIKVRAYQGTVNLSPENIKLIKDIEALNKPIMLISFGNPYLLSAFPAISTYLTAYGDAPVSQKAMLKAIFGEIDIQGKLPISISNTNFKIGHGIFVPSKKPLNI
ncbi:MAG TPA: glycoside hydrolase family 3 N-terminal domain-containing protein [Ignavibacteriaceae bacterium]|nr:glycoside hydrolase family 3 N-terminal domain-containing protein [Ignavibacteriaceae bacterium]